MEVFFLAYIEKNLDRKFEIAGFHLEEISNHFEKLFITKDIMKGISYKEVRYIIVDTLEQLYPKYQESLDNLCIKDVHKAIKSVLSISRLNDYYIVTCGILELFFEQYEVYDYLINREYNLRAEANSIGLALGLYRSAIPRSNKSI